MYNHHRFGGSKQLLDCGKAKGPGTSLPLLSMDHGLNNEGLGDGGFRFGVEDQIALVSGGGGSSSEGQRGFGEEQVPHGLDQVALSGYFPQSESYLSSFVQMATDISETEPAPSSMNFHGFSYDNISIPNSVPNMKSQVACLPNNITPSTSNNFTPDMTHNFYSASVLPGNTIAVPTTSQHIVLPSLSSDFTNTEVSEIEKRNANQKGCMCHVSSISVHSRQQMNHPLLEEFDDEFKDSELKLIIRKELSNSDVGSVGRIVLPKKDAEVNLPRLTEKEGIVLSMDDLELLVTWKFKYRFWPNNKSRMYIMEATGDFVKAHGLQVGDLFIIYRSSKSQNYVVRGKKGRRPPTTSEPVHCDCRNRCNMNEYTRQWLEHGQSSGQIGCSSTRDDDRIIYPPSTNFLENLAREENSGFHHFSHAAVVDENMSFGGL